MNINKTELDYKNTMALLVFFYISMVFADMAFLSKLRHTGRLLGIKTSAWKMLYASSSAIYTILTMVHLAYRKDKIMMIKKYITSTMPNMPKMR